MLLMNTMHHRKEKLNTVALIQLVAHQDFIYRLEHCKLRITSYSIHVHYFVINSTKGNYPLTSLHLAILRLKRKNHIKLLKVFTVGNGEFKNTGKHTSGLALVTSHMECKPITESYVITNGGSLQVNITLTVGSQI